MRHQHFGWDASPYSAKTRTYLRFKGIPHDDRHPHLWTLNRRIAKAVGRMVMPTVYTPGADGGRWLQDSSVIIDTLEREHPDPSITPPGPTQRLAALLLELHADEWWPTVIMHTRWNIAANARFAVAEFAREGVPWLPGFLGRPLAGKVAAKMASYRPVLGIGPDTHDGIDRFLDDTIATLQVHFEAHDYLLGGRPGIGDFALFGPLWAHVWRDPGSRDRFADAPGVVAWFERMLAPPETVGAWVPEDEIPATLDPLFERLFSEQWRYLEGLVAAVDTWAAAHPDAGRLPRALGHHPFTIGGATGQRRLITFTVWMAQRPLDAYRALASAERRAVDGWLDRVGGREALGLQITHRVTRQGHREVLERTPAEALGAGS